MTITQGRFVPLQPLDAMCFGIVCKEDGEGRRFFLLKDATHHWGLWEGTANGIEPRLVPLPGGKHEADPSMVILDGKIVAYFAAREGVDARPARHCEINVPYAKAPPSLAHINAIYQALKELGASIAAQNAQNAAQAQQIAALTQKIVELEQQLATRDDPALLARVEALTQQSADIVSALGKAGAVLGAMAGGASGRGQRGGG